MVRKKFVPENSQRIKTSLCIMPMKQVGSSLFELDQDDKNRQNGVSLLYLPLLPPMPKVGF